MNRDTVNWGVLLIVIATAGSGVYYQYQQTRPCAEPVSYAIGAVDSRFGISNAALISDVKAAAAIWNQAAGKTVLVYDSAAKLKINLLYDEREVSAKLGQQITREQEELEERRVALDAEQASSVAEQEAYNQRVKEVNARGGATKAEAAALEREREALNVQARSLDRELASYNTSVKNFNEKVKEFNQTAGRTFEEGQYVRDAAGERINIFEFIGSTQLKRVLAHEFGHAIGLDHNNDPAAIMFAKNESGNLVPTVTDLADLRALCGTNISK